MEDKNNFSYINSVEYSSSDESNYFEADSFYNKENNAETEFNRITEIGK